MELHNKLQMYVGFAEGGCQDVATIKLEGFVLVDVKELEALKAERDNLIEEVRLAREGRQSMCNKLIAISDAWHAAGSWPDTQADIERIDNLIGTAMGNFNQDCA